MDRTNLFIDSNSKWLILSEWTLRIKGYIAISPGLVIENCKSLIDSILKTILVEIDSKTDEDLKNEETSTLCKKVKQLLMIDENGYGKVLGSYTKSLTEFRNKLGEVSHGKDIHTLVKNREALLNDEIELFVLLTDSIASFLLKYYTNLYPSLASQKELVKYEEQDEFNEWFDKNNELVLIGDATLLPSSVLYECDNNVYKANLSEYLGKNEIIDKLVNSSNFETSHLLVRELSTDNSFSDVQIRNLVDAFFNNNQINWIATDDDIKDFFGQLFTDNENLLAEGELDRFMEYYTEDD